MFRVDPPTHKMDLKSKKKTLTIMSRPLRLWPKNTIVAYYRYCIVRDYAISEHFMTSGITWNRYWYCVVCTIRKYALSGKKYVLSGEKYAVSGKKECTHTHTHRLLYSWYRLHPDIMYFSLLLDTLKFLCFSPFFPPCAALIQSHVTYDLQ